MLPLFYSNGAEVLLYDDAQYPNTKGKGICKDGTQKCNVIDETGTWEVLANPVYPASEACNNKDDNCDGPVDNGIADVTTWNNYYATHACASESICGNCKQITGCVNGNPSAVKQVWTPTSEGTAYGNCLDSKDNDCDGKTDMQESDCLGV